MSKTIEVNWTNIEFNPDLVNISAIYATRLGEPGKQVWRRSLHLSTLRESKVLRIFLKSCIMSGRVKIYARVHMRDGNTYMGVIRPEALKMLERKVSSGVDNHPVYL
jgi:hypothetical protein